MASNSVTHDAWEGPSIAPGLSNSTRALKKASVFPKFADLFRVLGGAALVLAGVIYMLQGLDDVTSFLRQWVWLGLISVMAAGGYLCRIYLDDVKSARIFFILATALISVQFSQLGGMLFDIFQASSPDTLVVSADAFWQVAADRLSPQWFLLDLGLSVALAALVSFVGFAILLRKSFALLSAVFLLLNILILLPGRGPMNSFLVVSLMSVLLFVTRYQVFRSAAFARSLSGRLIRGILLFPLLIVLARNGFYVDSIAAVSALIASVSALCIYAFPRWFDISARISEALYAFGGIASFIAWSLFATGTSTSLSVAALYLLPLMLILFELSRVSHANVTIYRNLACLVGLAFSVVSCLLEVNALDVGLSLLFGICMAACGFVYELKRPLLAGGAMTILSVAALLLTSFANVAVNTWLFLAIAGVFLVLFSSLIDRYSGHLLAIWRKVNDFE